MARALAGGLALACALAAAPAAVAQEVSVSLADSDATVRDVSANAPSYGGETYVAGDITGDGRQDLLASTGTGAWVFAGPLASSVTSTNPGPASFFIDPELPELLSTPIATGDVNNDGRDDVVLSLIGVDRTYVIFGDAYETTVRPSNIGDNGFIIEGATGSVAVVEDMNSDGLAEVLIGDTRSAYVVFGKQGSAPVDVADLGGRGFLVTYPSAHIGHPEDVASVGDVNGDGRGDFAIAHESSQEIPNGVYVVFGQAGTESLDLGDPGDPFFLIEADLNPAGNPGSWVHLDGVGTSVDGAGDQNGDGKDDVIVGAPLLGPSAGTEYALWRGGAYVIFGKSTTTTIHPTDTIGDRGNTQGYLINGGFAGDQAGEDVAGGRDVNGDGRPDVVIGAPNAHNADYEEESGAAYVVYGKRGPTTINLWELTEAQGYRLDGTAPDLNAGRLVALAGDLVGLTGPSVLVSQDGQDVYVFDEGRLDRAMHHSDIQDVNLTSSRFHISRAGARASARRPSSSVLRYRPRRRATVTIRLFRAVPGRRAVRRGQVRCVAPSRALRRAPRCERVRPFVTVRRRHTRPGSQRFTIGERVGRRSLEPGSYTALVYARTARRSFGPFQVSFEVRR